MYFEDSEAVLGLLRRLIYKLALLGLLASQLVLTSRLAAGPMDPPGCGVPESVARGLHQELYP